MVCIYVGYMTYRYTYLYNYIYSTWIKYEDLTL